MRTASALFGRPKTFNERRLRPFDEDALQALDNMKDEIMSLQILLLAKKIGS